MAEMRVIQWRGPVATNRRAIPLDPPTFLIDQDRRIPLNRGPEIMGQTLDLPRAFDVARKKDEAPGLGVTKERGFLDLKFGPGAAEDIRAGRQDYRCTTGMQSTSSEIRTEQNRRASVKSVNPTARRR